MHDDQRRRIPDSLSTIAIHVRCAKLPPADGRFPEVLCHPKGLNDVGPALHFEIDVGRKAQIAGTAATLLDSELLAARTKLGRASAASYNDRLKISAGSIAYRARDAELQPNLRCCKGRLHGCDAKFVKIWNDSGCRTPKGPGVQPCAKSLD
jgi:hypothetical protein